MSERTSTPDIEYICHPVLGNVAENIADIERIMSKRHTANNILFAPYLIALRYLKDDVPEQRALGMAANDEFFRTRTITKVYVCGERVSSGMQGEILLAFDQAIPIETEPHLEEDVRKILPFHLSYLGQRSLDEDEALIAVVGMLGGDLVAYSAKNPPVNREEYNAGKKGTVLSYDECFGINWADYRDRDRLMDEIALRWGNTSIQSLARSN